MVKAMVAIIVLALAGLAVVYFVGGIGSWDPGAKGAAAKAAITPGMTWKQVLDTAGEPGRYQTIVLEEKTVNGEKIEIAEPGAAMRFEMELFQKDFTNKNMPEGFLFNYVFTQQVAFDVLFDAAGNVMSLSDVATMADLLGTRK